MVGAVEKGFRVILGSAQTVSLQTINNPEHPMSDERHTKEPWITHEESGVLGMGKVLITTKARQDEHIIEIGEVSVGYDEQFDKEQEANGRRIVACVNACASISTEDLEKYDAAAFVIGARNAVTRLEGALKRIAHMTDRDGNQIEMHLEELRGIARAALSSGGVKP